MIVFIISAPSGSGKSTLVGRLLNDVSRLMFSVSHTTRAPRGQEKHGENYYFISRAEFERGIARGDYLEYAEVFGNLYGTHRDILDRAREAGCDVVLDIDVQGAAQLKERIPDAVTIFVLAPSRQILEQRLRDRGEDAEETIARRLRDAAREIRNYSAYDYIVINNELNESAQTLSGIVRAERARRPRMAGEIRPILETFDLNL